MPKRISKSRLLQDTCMQDWDVYEVQLPGRRQRTRHIVGRLTHANHVHISAPILSISAEKRAAKTEDGTVFTFGWRMQGSLECDSVWSRWEEKNGATDAVRITLEVRDLIAPIAKRPVPEFPRGKSGIAKGARLLTPLV